jgi:hypothetical protein
MQNVDLLDTTAAAAYIGSTPATLNTWRCTKSVRIPYIKCGRSVRYRKSDLDEFLERNTQDRVEVLGAVG